MEDFVSEDRSCMGWGVSAGEESVSYMSGCSFRCHDWPHIAEIYLGRVGSLKNRSVFISL